MKMRRKKDKLLAMLLAIVFLCLPTTQIMANKLSEAENELKQLEQQLQEAKNLISGLESSKDDIETKITQLDAQLGEISTRLSTLETQLEQKNTEIADTQEQLDEIREVEADQYAQMKLRIQFMYENSLDNSYVEIFCSSGSFSDLINNIDYVRQLSEYDRAMLTAYEQTEEEIANYETQLEADKASLEELKALAQEEQNTVKALENAKIAELSKVNSDIVTAENAVDTYEDEIAAQNEMIAEIRAEMAREAAANQQKVYNGGAFAWPCPSSSRVTSDYGTRTSPTSGASTNHKGIDIGASYGADIVAAADGEVTSAGYSSASGNYVIINHGSGIRTVYMHASSLNVSKGDTVVRGQVIAKVGSTGISTGNHLHFGVTVDGEYVSPWNYVG